MIWTNVEEYNPDAPGTYLVLGKTGNPMFGRWDGENWNKGKTEVVYWMHVPERPADLPEWMPSYLNKDNNDLAILLEAIAGAANERMMQIWRNNARVQQNLLTIRRAALACLYDLVDGLNHDQLVSIDRRAGKAALRVLCTASPAAHTDWHIVDGPNLLTVVCKATEDCEFCDKTPKEMKLCGLRKALAQLGIVSDSPTQGDCPYIDQASVSEYAKKKSEA